MDQEHFLHLLAFSFGHSFHPESQCCTDGLLYVVDNLRIPSVTQCRVKDHFIYTSPLMFYL